MPPGSAARAGLLAALASATAYGLNAPFAPLAAAAGISGADLVFWRVFVMLAVVAAIALAQRRALRLPAGTLGGVAVLALATSVTTLGYITALTRIPVGVAVIVFYTFPLIILVVAPILERTRPSPARLAVFALAFAGLVIALGAHFQGLDPLGLALAAFAATGTATQILVGSRVTQRVDSAVLVVFIHLGVLPIALATALAIGGPVPPGRLAEAPVAVGAIVLGYVAAYLLQVRAVRLGRPAAVGLAYTLEPVVSTVTAALLLGERLAAPQYVGGAMVLAAIIASVRLEQRAAPAARE